MVRVACYNRLMTTTYRDPMPLPTDFDVLRALMNSTADLAQDFMSRFFTEHGRGELDLAGRLYDEYAKNAKVLDTIVRDILVDPKTKVGDEIRTVNGPLIVVAFNDQRTVAVLTEDGLPYEGGRGHEGPLSRSIRVERFNDGRQVFHGYIDSVSRRLTQTG